MKVAERGQTFPREESGDTEALHPKSAGLDVKPLEEVVALLWQDQLEAVKVVEGALRQIAAAAKLFAQTLRKEGRVFYVGAGTSGRLGVLDAKGSRAGKKGNVIRPCNRYQRQRQHTLRARGDI